MIITVENGKAMVQINTFGAELYRYQIKKDGYEALWNGDSAWWTGRSPVLFPVIGVLLNGVYRYRGEEYQMPKHGFAHKKEFQVLQQADTSATFSLKADRETKVYYPFEFELIVHFELMEENLEICYTVKNLGESTMYFSLGAHPAFYCNLGERLEFEKEESLERIYMDETGILTGETSPVLKQEKTIEIKEDTFKRDALMFTGYRSESVSLVRKDKRITVSFGKAPYLGLWAKPGAPYVCIEPWYGINDSYQEAADISQKPGIVKLEAGGQFAFPFTISVQDEG